MRITVTRAGILDTIQDMGRTGYQHLGINPSGAMDRYAAQLANALLGNDLKCPVLELHFPASEFDFDAPVVFVITGADFCATFNGHPIEPGQPVATGSGTLSFKKMNKGARAYLAFLNELNIQPWLNSGSTNLKSQSGGYKGRRLLAGDVIHFNHELSHSYLIKHLPWRTAEAKESNNVIRFLPGSEWNWLTTEAQHVFQSTSFTISASSDRMGYRLVGEPLVQLQQQLVSSPVTYGTIQLLPNGQCIILMADHQTTGGYPRVGNVISIDRNKLAQLNPNEPITFKMAAIDEAEKMYIAQQEYLEELRNTCKLKMQNLLHAHL